MSVDRIERVNSLLKRVIADSMFRVMASDEVNPSVITVTEVACAKDLRNATVRVSVFGEPELQKRALSHLIHHARAFERVISREVRMKFTPVLRFELDHSLEKGDKVLAIIAELENGATKPPTADAADNG